LLVCQQTSYQYFLANQITSTTSQLEVLFSHNKSATATSHSQPEVLSLMKL